MNTSSASFYNRFSHCYPLADLFLKAHKQRLFREVNSHPTGMLLEIGVGNGAHLKHYKNHQVTGIDNSTVMLKTAQKSNPDDVTLMMMDGEALLFPNETFDYVVLSHLLAVVSDPEQVMREARRVLKTGGRLFILNHFTPDNWLGLIDRAFNPIAKLFYFKSLFHLPVNSTVQQLTVEQHISLGIGGYFKLLIYRK